jgi:YD repeat-containing protein
MAGHAHLMSKTIHQDQWNPGDQWEYTYNNHMATGITTTRYGGERFAMEYDAVGNQVLRRDRQDDRTMAMTYDSSNRITEVRDQDTGSTLGLYSYDHQGFRVRKWAYRKTTSGPVSREHAVEVLYPSMYFGLEKRIDIDTGREIPGSQYAVNNVYVNGVRVAAVLPNGKSGYQGMTLELSKDKKVRDAETVGKQ